MKANLFKTLMFIFGVISLIFVVSLFPVDLPFSLPSIPFYKGNSFHLKIVVMELFFFYCISFKEKDIISRYDKYLKVFNTTLLLIFLVLDWSIGLSSNAFNRVFIIQMVFGGILSVVLIVRLCLEHKKNKIDAIDSDV
ncbi:MAG: hypothetical protein WCO58_00365 [bacterium]